MIDDPERLPSWLMTTTRRLCWRVVQKRRREHPVEEADLREGDSGAGVRPLFHTMPTMDAIAEEWHRQEFLTRSMTALGDRCRRLITLLFLDRGEPSYDEIEATMGIPKGSIGPTRTRCLQQLRTILEGLGYKQPEP
jgi:DNA-directed RNA polymerase specialized sigma24 family protein